MDLDGGGDYWFTVAATVRVQKVVDGLKWHKDILLRFWGQAHGLKCRCHLLGPTLPEGLGGECFLTFSTSRSSYCFSPLHHSTPFLPLSQLFIFCNHIQEISHQGWGHDSVGQVLATHDLSLHPQNPLRVFLLTSQTVC